MARFVRGTTRTLNLSRSGRVQCALEFTPRGIWVGACWKKTQCGFDIWIQPLPMCSLHVWSWNLVGRAK
jgi:hypothetical protein